jgi:hypothetical protein
MNNLDQRNQFGSEYTAKCMKYDVLIHTLFERITRVAMTLLVN